MTEPRRYCLRGHDTAECGRDSSYRCLKCKREAGRAARAVRKQAETAIRDAARLRHEEEAAAAYAVANIAAILPHLGIREQVERARRLGVEIGVHVCEWHDRQPDACDLRTHMIFCGPHMRQAKRDAAAAAVEAVRARW